MNKLLTLLCSICVLNTFALDNLWQNVSARRLDVPGEQKIIPLQSNKVQLNDASFRTLQLLIPSEASGQSILMQLPTPDGGYRTFKVFERVTMEKELADKYPMIKTYQAIAADDPFVTAKLDYTEFGFHAMVFSKEGIFFIDPYTNVNTGFYNCYYKKDYVRQPGQYSVCETPASDESRLLNPSNTTTGQRLVNNSNNAIVTDGKIRTFRLALACTIEYSAAVASPNPTKARVLSAMVTSVNRVNGVLEKDLSFHMNLVPNNDTLIFITSDSYSNTNGSSMLGQNQTVCDARIGNANYDIGHVFSTGGGGVAYLGCVCNSANKARGVTGSSNPVGDAYDIDYVIHEMGHQYGANHTFNAGTGSCAGNRASSAAFEPGSGTTIMAYAGICGTNDIQPHSDDYFHRASINEIYNYIASSTTCAVITNSNNTPPDIVDYTATYYIPYKTSFEITAAASDANGDPIKYCWEEYDLGPEGSWDNNAIQTAPIFRSFLPTTSPTRTFPKWDSLITNSIRYKGEVLPETTRDVKFRCTVRDINNGYGRFNAPSGNLTLKSTITSSLFRVTSFPSASSIMGNTNQTITWDVAGTTASPISCANVDIYLSLDSARTFPYLLASNTPNDGSESVLIPNVFTNTASARIKVKGSGNVFFDLNNGWIKINQAVVSQFSVNDSVICTGRSLTFTNNSTGSPDSVRWTINGGTPSTSTSQATVVSTFNTAGTFIISLSAYKAGVASTPFTKTIKVNPKSTSSVTQTICEGQSVTVGGQTFTTAQVNRQIVLSNANSLGCDSTITLNLTVNPKSTSSVTQTICEGQSVTVGGQTFTTAQVNRQIVLSNANSLGCDSTITLNLTVNPKSTSSVTQTICEGQSVTVGGQTFTTAQVNRQIVLSNANSLGCDSTITLNLTVNPKSTSSVTQTICEGQSVTVGGQTFTTAQVNRQIVLSNANSLGCDSTITLNLTVNPKSTSSVTQTICEGQSVTVGGQTFTTAQVNRQIVLSNANSLGCDSTITLNLTVNPKSTSSVTQTICEGQSVTVGGQTFTTAQVNRQIVLSNANSLGCDSTITLNLTVNPKSTSSVTQTICEGQSVTVGGQTFTTAQVNRQIVLSNANSLGCDSTITLNLTVNPKSTSSVTQTICEGQSVTVGGQTFTTAQVNRQIVLSNANSLGCDSTITLNLTLNPKSTSSVTQTICEGQSVTVGGQTFTTAQVNRQIVLSNANSLGCDSTITLNLTVNPLPSTPTITQSNDTLYSNLTIAGATYYWYKATVLVATTSVPYYKIVSSGPYTLIISNNNCASASSGSFNAVYTGIKTSKYDIGFLIIPNPNNGQFDLQVSTVKSGQYVLSMYNVAGQELRKETLNISKGTSTLHFNADHLEKGMYFISVYGEEGMVTQTVLIQ